VGIGPDHQVPRGHQTFIRDEGVANARIAEFEVVEDPVTLGKPLHGLGERGGRNVLGGHKVVVDQRDLVGVEDPRRAHPGKDLGRKRRGDIRTHDQVKPGEVEFSRPDNGNARMRRQNLLGNRHAHLFPS